MEVYSNLEQDLMGVRCYLSVVRLSLSTCAKAWKPIPWEWFLSGKLLPGGISDRSHMCICLVCLMLLFSKRFIFCYIDMHILNGRSVLGIYDISSGILLLFSV